MRSNESIKVSQLDIDFTEIIWTAHGIKKKLGKQDIEILDDALEQYRLYVQGSGHAEVIMKKIIQILKGRKTSTHFRTTTGLAPEDLSLFRSDKANRIQAVMSVNGYEKTKEDSMGFQHQILKSKQPSQSAKVAATAQIMKVANTHIRKSGDPRNARRELFGSAKKSVIGKKVQDGATLLAIQMERQNQILDNQLNAMNQMMSQERESGSNRIDDLQEQLVNVQKVNMHLAKQLNKLNEMMLKKENVCEISWSDIPQWISIQYAKGLKNLCLGAIKMPFKVSNAVFNKFVYQPMYDVYNFFERKVMFLLGMLEWTLVIGLTVYVFVYKGDEIQEILGSVKPVFDILLFPARFVVKHAIYYLPSAAEYTNTFLAVSWYKLIEPLIILFWKFLYAIANFMLGGLNKVLGKLTYKSTWITIDAPQVELYQNPIANWQPWWGYMDAYEYNKIILEAFVKQCIASTGSFDQCLWR